MSDVTDWATIVVTGGLGIAGFWVANSIKLRRRTELEVAAISRRWDAYERFFSATKPAAPIRDVSKGDNEVVLSESDRKKLHDALATWWFDEGGGMLLGEPSRSIYFIAKGDLVCDDNALTPTSARNWIAGQSNRTIGRSDLAIRQLSLLRSAMRADLGIIGRPYGKPLDDVDRDFLRSAGVKLWEPQRSALVLQRTLPSPARHRHRPRVATMRRGGVGIAAAARTTREATFSHLGVVSPHGSYTGSV